MASPAAGAHPGSGHDDGTAGYPVDGNRIGALADDAGLPDAMDPAPHETSKRPRS